jgi:hypothetical protein
MGPDTLTGAFEQLLALLELMGTVEIGVATIAHWPEGALETFLSIGLLIQTGNAREVVCWECDRHCVVAPYRRTRHGGPSVYVHPCVEGRYGLIEFTPNRMRQWRLELSALTRWLARALRLVGEPVQQDERLWLLGTHQETRSASPVWFAWNTPQPAGAPAVPIRLPPGGEPGVLLVPFRRPAGVETPVHSLRLVTVKELLQAQMARLSLNLERFRTLVGRSRPPKPGVVPFPVSSETRWEDVRIRVLDAATLELQVGRHKERRTFQEMGMADTRKKPPEPNAAWALLLLLAAHGDAPWRGMAAPEDLRTRIKELRQALRTVFKLTDSPIHDYEPQRGWRPRFVLTDLRR